MTKQLSDSDKKKEQKFIRIRIGMVLTALSGFILFSIINTEMDGHGARNIKQVYEIFLGGLMVFVGGTGTMMTTLFLRLLRKNKKKKW